MNHLNSKDFDKALNVIEKYQDSVSDCMKTALKTFIKHKDYCIAADKSEYSNALTESIIQKIKLIKRNAYGFRNFLIFKKRIFHYFETKCLRDSLTRLPKISDVRSFAQSI